MGKNVRDCHRSALRDDAEVPRQVEEVSNEAFPSCKAFSFRNGFGDEAQTEKCEGEELVVVDRHFRRQML